MSFPCENEAGMTFPELQRMQHRIIKGEMEAEQAKHEAEAGAMTIVAIHGNRANLTGRRFAFENASSSASRF